jgi:hypothetical protein
LNSANRNACVLLVLISSVLSVEAQTIYDQKIKGLRVNGCLEARFPVVLLDSRPLSISFDVDTKNPENFHIKLLHCDKNWNVTQTTFVNDDFKNVTRGQIPFPRRPLESINTGGHIR